MYRLSVHRVLPFSYRSAAHTPHPGGTAPSARLTRRRPRSHIHAPPLPRLVIISRLSGAFRFASCFASASRRTTLGLLVALDTDILRDVEPCKRGVEPEHGGQAPPQKGLRPAASQAKLLKSAPASGRGTNLLNTRFQKVKSPTRNFTLLLYTPWTCRFGEISRMLK